MIKRIACLSTLKHANTSLSHSEQVFVIFDSARVYNKANDIFGAFLVCDDIILQILEGESDKLATSVYQINRDPRIVNVSVVMNKAIADRAFSRWSLKLISENCDAHTAYLHKLKKLLGQSLSVTDTTDRFRLAKIFGQSDSAEPSPTSPPREGTGDLVFDDQYLTMKSWPRPTQLRLTAPLMKLCPLLIGRTVAYNRLTQLGLFTDERELREQLTSLYQANALEIVDRKACNNVTPLPDKTPKGDSGSQSNRFSQALRNFIHNHKAKGFNSR